MPVAKSIIALFVIAAIFDGALGLLFLITPNLPFDIFHVTPPNHVAYVQFPAALLIIFGLMFAAIAANPIGNRNLIPYGILLKLAYCGVTIGHWATSARGIPNFWKPFVVADILFLILFILAWSALGRSGHKAKAD